MSEPRETSKDDKGEIQMHVRVFGDQDSGKETVMNKIVDCLSDEYNLSERCCDRYSVGITIERKKPKPRYELSCRTESFLVVDTWTARVAAHVPRSVEAARSVAQKILSSLNKENPNERLCHKP